MAQDKDKFIEQLSRTHKARRPLPLPGRRAAVWYGASLLFTFLVMRAVQVFRPGFPGQMVAHPVFTAEVFTGLLTAGIAAYLVFLRAVPGEEISRRLLVLFAGVAAVFVGTLALSFTRLAPPSSAVGVRAACHIEVLVYGLITLVALAWMMRRAYPRFSLRTAALLGVGAGLVPAALMQLACMYDPMHALDHHYGPVMILCVLGVLLSRMVSR